MHDPSPGTTLLELLIVLALATLMLGGAVYGWQKFQEQTLAQNHLRLWFDAMVFARNYALASGQVVGVCAGTKRCENHSDYARGWLIFTSPGGIPGNIFSGNAPATLVADKDILLTSSDWGQGFTLTSRPAPPVYFDMQGRADKNRRFVLCSKNNAQTLFLVRSGRLRHAPLATTDCHKQAS